MKTTMSGWRNWLDGINGRLNSEEEKNSKSEAIETTQNEIQKYKKTEKQQQ